jgi:hypothetical protein
MRWGKEKNLPELGVREPELIRLKWKAIDKNLSTNLNDGQAIFSPGGHESKEWRCCFGFDFIF